MCLFNSGVASSGIYELQIINAKGQINSLLFTIAPASGLYLAKFNTSMVYMLKLTCKW